MLMKFTFRAVAAGRLARLAAAAALAGARSDDETVGWSAQRLYGEAKDAMASQGLAEGDQVPREARGALSLRALRAAGAARDRLLPTGRTASAPRRSPRPTASSSSIRTTPNVDYAWYLKGWSTSTTTAGHPLQAHHARHERPRSEGVARGVRRVQGTGDALPGLEIRRRTRRCACATSSTRSPRTKCTSRAIT